MRGRREYTGEIGKGGFVAEEGGAGWVGMFRDGGEGSQGGAGGMGAQNRAGHS